MHITSSFLQQFKKEVQEGALTFFYESLTQIESDESLPQTYELVSQQRPNPSLGEMAVAFKTFRSARK